MTYEHTCLVYKNSSFVSTGRNRYKSKKSKTYISFRQVIYLFCQVYTHDSNSNITTYFMFDRINLTITFEVFQFESSFTRSYNR